MSRAHGRYRGQARSEVDARPAGLGARTTGIRLRRVSGGPAGTERADLAMSGPSPMILPLRRTRTDRSSAALSRHPIASVSPDEPHAFRRTATRGASRDGLRRDALLTRAGRVFGTVPERFPRRCFRADAGTPQRVLTVSVPRRGRTGSIRRANCRPHIRAGRWGDRWRRSAVHLPCGPARIAGGAGQLPRGRARMMPAGVEPDPPGAGQISYAVGDPAPGRLIIWYLAPDARPGHTVPDVKPHSRVSLLWTRCRGNLVAGVSFPLGRNAGMAGRFAAVRPTDIGRTRRAIPTPAWPATGRIAMLEAIRRRAGLIEGSNPEGRHGGMHGMRRYRPRGSRRPGAP